MMRFLRGTFFRIGGIGYNDFEDFPVPGPAEPNLGLHATVTAGMSFGPSSIFHRDYVLPPPRELYLPSDDFTRLPNPPGNGPLGSKWDFPMRVDPARFPAPQIINNTVKEGTENTDCIAYYEGDGVAWEIDPNRPEQLVGQFAQIRMQDPLPSGSGGGTPNYVGVVLRADIDRGSGANARFYLGGVFATATAGVCDCRLYYWNGTAFMPIATPNIVLTWIIGDLLRCEVSGQGVAGDPVRLKLFHNETTVFNVTLPLGVASKPGGGVHAPGPGIAIKGTDGSFWLDQWNAGEMRPPPDHLFHRENWNQHADGPMGQPWSFPFALPDRPRVSNHEVVAGATTPKGAVAYYNQTGFNASNQYSQVRLRTIPAAYPQGVGVTVRTGGGVGPFYAVLVHGPNDYRIWWYDSLAGSYVQKKAGTGYTLAANGMLRAEVTGNSPVVINVYFNGVLILQHTLTNQDTEIRVGGFPGLAIFDPAGTTLHLDDWEGGRL